MNKEFSYLLELIDDPSSEVFNAVENKVVRMGRPVIGELEKYWEQSRNVLVQTRIENLLLKINFNFLKEQIKNWLSESSPNILFGSYLVSLFQYPNIELPDLKKTFEDIKRDLWLEMNPQLTAIDKVRVLNHILFQVYEFQEVRGNLTSPQHFFLNNLLDSRRGNQYSLAMLYVSLAQIINLPIFGLKMPHSYLLVFNDKSLAKYAGNDKSEFLFYINPYNKGAIFGRQELTQMLKKNNVQIRDNFYEPASNVFFISQIFSALMITFKRLGYPDKVEQLSELVRFIFAEQNNLNKQ